MRCSAGNFQPDLVALTAFSQLQLQPAAGRPTPHLPSPVSLWVAATTRLTACKRSRPSTVRKGFGVRPALWCFGEGTVSVDDSADQEAGAEGRTEAPDDHGSRTTVPILHHPGARRVLRASQSAATPPPHLAEGAGVIPHPPPVTLTRRS